MRYQDTLNPQPAYDPGSGGLTNDLGSGFTAPLWFGAVMSVTGAAPITSSGGENPTIGMPVATVSADGYLDKDDWKLFHDKKPLDTGLVMGGALTINTDTTKFDVAALVAFFADYTDPLNVVGNYVSYGPTSANTVPNIATQNVTYVGINKLGVLIKQGTPFTRAQRRSIVSLGAVVHSNRTVINTTNCIAASTREVAPQIHDLMEAVGVLNMDGNIYGPNGANLNINKTSGSIFKFGSNFVNSVEDPNAITQGSGTALTFRYRLNNGTEYANATAIDPNNYDLGGTLTAVSASTPWTVQRIAMFSTGLTRIQYGQGMHKDLGNALANYSNEGFVTEQNIRENGVLRCLLVVKRGCTDLSDPSQAVFLEVSKFGAASSAGVTVDWGSPGSIGATTPNIAKFGNATDYSEFETDGSLLFRGAATVFDDMWGDAAELQRTGSGVSLNTTELQVEYLTSSNLADYMLKSIQLPHGWKEGSVIKPHLHWMQTTSGVPNFLFQYRWQKLGSAKVTSWTNLACNTAVLTYVSGTLHNIARTSAGITPPSGAAISDIIQFRIIRDNANTSGAFSGADPVAATVGVIAFDVHVEKDRVGSRAEFTA